MKPTVALVGRPNVGKSTIFNRLVGKKISIIEDTPGVTRDRIYSDCEYQGKKFLLVDTGGIDLDDAAFNESIMMQASIAIDQADLILFVVDGKEGLTANDYAVRDMLRKSKKKVLVVINKVDSKDYQDHQYDFYELGFDDYYPVSGEQNIGFYELLEAIVAEFPHISEEEEDHRVKFSLIGRPNVGKSSLMNALLNEERTIVSDVAGTTRDSIDTVFTYHKQEYVVIDTAGMRKKGKVYEPIEKYSLIRSLRAIDRSDVCLLVISAEEGVIEHDKHIAGYAIEAGKGLIIVVNKWDTVENPNTTEYTKMLRSEFQFASYAPIVFVSALTRKRIATIMPEVIRVYDNCHRQVKTSVLNDVVADSYSMKLPPTYKGNRLKIYYTSQTGTAPPKFTFFVNNKGLVHFSYERYLENRLRENFDFEGTPIVLQFKNRGDE